MTQEQLAIKAGTKKSNISKIENAKGNIQLSTLIRIFEKGLNKKVGLTFLYPTTPHNINYPASSAAMVYLWHLSAQTAFRLDRKSPANLLLHLALIRCLLY